MKRKCNNDGLKSCGNGNCHIIIYLQFKHVSALLELISSNIHGNGFMTSITYLPVSKVKL